MLFIVIYLDYYSLIFCWLFNDLEERKELILIRLVYVVLLYYFVIDYIKINGGKDVGFLRVIVFGVFDVLRERM